MKKTASASEMPEEHRREEMERIIARLSEAASSSEIENQFGYDASEVSRIMQSAGVRCRLDKKYTHKPYRKHTDAEIVERLMQPGTSSEVLRKFKYH